MDIQERHIRETEKKTRKRSQCKLKQIEIKFDKEAYKEYEELKKSVAEQRKTSKKPTYEQLLKSINLEIENLKTNPYRGDLIPRRNIPKAVVKKYGTDKILRIDLVGYWRLLYTIIGEEIKVIAFILEFMDHDRYNKLFGYKKR